LVDLTIRLASIADLDAILPLQAENFIARLTPRQRADGFLSAEFPRTQLAAMVDDLGIDVAISNGNLIAYLCATRCTGQSQAPVVDAMLRAFASARFDGRPLDPASS
jgi:hypothetical protein